MFVRRPRHAAYSVQSPYAWVKRAVVGAAFLAFAGLIWYVASNRDTLETENLNPPLVQAPVSPIKERAENPGGMEIPNQDKEVFNLLDVVDEDDAGAVASAVETSRNKPADKDMLAEVAPEKAVAQKAAAEAPKPAPVAEAKPNAVEPVKPVAQKPVEKKATPLPEKVESFTNKIVADRQQQAGEIKSAQTAATGDWAVQLGSYTAEESALKGVKIFQDKFPELLDTLTPLVKRVELKNGVYYRVYFTGIASKAESSALCAKLKQKNQGCLNVKH